MEDLLYRLTEMIERLKKESSIDFKKVIMRGYPDLKDILSWVYNPNINFHITGDQVQNHWISNVVLGYPNLSLYELLSKLSKREITGSAALEYCIYYIDNNYKYKDTIIKILNRDLKCGINIKTINFIWPYLIPEFNVPLAHTYNPDKHNVFNNDYFISRKLDGIRCLCFIEGMGVTLVSRKGKEFTGLEIIKKEIHDKWDYNGDIILDGELCIMKDGIEDFKAIASEIHRKDHVIKNPLFYVFDYYPTHSFRVNKPFHVTFSSKYLNLKNMIKNFKHIKLLEHSYLKDMDQLKIPNGWEGFILRKDAPTVFKRSNNLLKVKVFCEADFEVQGIEYSNMVIEGLDTPVVGALIIDYRGSSVKIGSGISQEERMRWYKEPELISNKVITVKYFSESKDKDGNLSLRFPIFKGIRRD